MSETFVSAHCPGKGKEALRAKPGLTGVRLCGAEDANITKRHKVDDTQIPQIVILFSFSFK